MAMYQAFDDRATTNYLGVGVVTDGSELVLETDLRRPNQGLMMAADFNAPIAKHADIHTSFYWHILSGSTKVSGRGGADFGFALYDNNTSTGATTLILAVSPYLYRPTYDALYPNQHLNEPYKFQLGATLGSDLKLSESVMLRSRITFLPENDVPKTLLVSSSLKYALPS